MVDPRPLLRRIMKEAYARIEPVTFLSAPFAPAGVHFMMFTVPEKISAACQAPDCFDEASMLFKSASTHTSVRTSG